MFRQWKLLDPLGRGDSAIVYSATNETQEAAVKIFFPEALDKHGFSEEKQRLELQLQLRDCDHPNLVRVYDGGVAEELGNTLFLIMQKVPGSTLDKVLAKVPRSSISTLIKQLADGAHFLEDRDLVHRDIKPANIIVNDEISHLTLLDFGIIKNLVADESGRLSGNRFVATPRYSPPEFVWREEVESKEAWRAVTFYQIGGVLHDLIMRKCLFDGDDQPSARLYDAIKLLSPQIEADDCERWLIQLAKCCLIKDWRERLRSIPSWESFLEPTDKDDIIQKRMAVRLRQVRREEMEIAKQMSREKADGNKRIQALWELQDKVFLDTHRFLSGTQIFPRFTTTNRSSPDAMQYKMTFELEKRPDLGFDCHVKTEIIIQIVDIADDATELSIRGYRDGTESIFEGKWVEHLTIESASSIIQRSLLEIANRVVPMES